MMQKLKLGFHVLGVNVFDEGREILPKIREPFHHNLTLCAECFIRNYDFMVSLF